MALLEQWQKVAYNEKADRGELQRFWQRYFLLEKGVYEKLLTNPDEKVEGTVKELADKYGLSIMDMTRFLGRYQREPGRAEPDRHHGGRYEGQPRIRQGEAVQEHGRREGRLAL